MGVCSWRWSIWLLTAQALLSALPCWAETKDISTEQLFGFLIGSDVDEPGAREIETETTGQLSKGAGSYNVLSQRMAIEYTPKANLRFEVGGSLAHYAVSSVPGFDDVLRTSLQEVSVEIRQRLLDRGSSGIGLTLLAEPHLGFVDDVSGQPANRYGSAFAFLLDKNISPLTIAALNVAYEPEISRLHSDGTWSRSAVAMAGFGAMTAVTDGLFVGGELRYLRSYNSLGLTDFHGDAIFVGPALFWLPSPGWRLTTAWSTQVAGRLVDVPSRLDLADFTKHEFKVRIGREF